MFGQSSAPKDFYGIQRQTMKKLIRWITTPPVTGPSNILIIRWMIATIYIWEIVDKFMGGSPISPIAAGELLGSILLLLGLLTRVTCLLFIADIIVSLPIAWHTGLPASLPNRLEYAQFLTCLYLFVAGPGRRSLDFRISTANKIYRLN
jgi:uncharacterized membrane protein YphA (DoxX/SURF4 family)